MKNKDIDLKALGPQLLALAGKCKRYAGIFFFLLVAAVYGFLLFRIDSLGNVQPPGGDVSAQGASAAIPKINPTVAKQLESMKDNSVNVQTLFDNARGNPFQE